MSPRRVLPNQMLERGPIVKFHGRRWNKWAAVVDLTGFSGHADQDDFMRTLGPLAGRVGRVKLVHGEIDRAEALAQSLRDRGFADVGIPERDETALVA